MRSAIGKSSTPASPPRQPTHPSTSQTHPEPALPAALQPLAQQEQQRPDQVPKGEGPELPPGGERKARQRVEGGHDLLF